MKVLLAIETSGKYGSVAIAKAHNLLQKTDVPQNADLMNPGVVAIDLPTDRGSAQSLASSIDFLLRSEKLNPNDLGCIAVLSGPGSFTGLRVGIATAKSMAYALSIPTVELDTLDCILHQTRRTTEGYRLAHMLLDAYRGQLFVKTISGNTIARGAEEGTVLSDIEGLVQSAMSADCANEQVFVGPGCERLQRYLAREEKLDTVKKWFESVEWINDWRSTPHASSVAELGWRKWSSGDTLDPFLLLPEYFRGSAAEEKASKPV
ncbi:MAG: tRNA (adenosine(37)-N6)-threonylcarbamoyltransferase complex dimerization subunit type 1 TsaB [Pirellula sp.]